jgi:hypothetical protein
MAIKHAGAKRMLKSGGRECCGSNDDDDNDDDDDDANQHTCKEKSHISPR